MFGENCFEVRMLRVKNGLIKLGGYVDNVVIKSFVDLKIV